MPSKTAVLVEQRTWARRAGLVLDDRGYLPSWQDNLQNPMSAHALAAFLRGSGNELQESKGRPAKMRAAHSSSALVVNFFDYWSESPDRVLGALGLAQGAKSLRFEAQFPTGLEGEPPNLDICIERTDGALVAVESKFTEWLAPKSASKECFKPKYFPSDRRLWERLGLWGAQRLAEDIHAGVKRFRYLDAPQLLKHALGLATSARAFELCYLHYEVHGAEADVHRAELQEFSRAVAGDFPFHAMTYQQAYERIRHECAAGDAAYQEYLAARYFS
jgi:hypothetical protein